MQPRCRQDVDTLDEMLAVEEGHGLPQRWIHPRAEVLQFHLVSILVGGNSAGRMRERASAAEVWSRPDAAGPTCIGDSARQAGHFPQT